MNKTVNINLAGVFFHIDEDAYLKLQRYLEAIKRSFTDSQGRSEIISDIEARIAELFSERIQNDKQVVGISLVDEVIGIMGQPEDYMVDEEIFDDQPHKEYTYQTKNTRKLYRDPDSSYIAGVAVGLAHYLGVSVLFVRFLWVFLTLFSGGTFIIIYIIFWALVPEALTTAEKLTMKGEPVNISNIEKKIKDGINSVTETVQNIDLKKSGEKIKEGIDQATDSISDTVNDIDFEKQSTNIRSSSKNFFDSIGDIFQFFFKVFAKFFGVIMIIVGASTLLALIVGFLTIGITDFFEFGMDITELSNETNAPFGLIAILAFLASAIPFFFIFYLGLKILVKNLKSIGNVAKFTLLGLWIVSIIGLSIIGLKTGVEFSKDANVVLSEKKINIKSGDTLNLAMVAHDNYNRYFDRSYGNVDIYRDENGNEVIAGRSVRLIVRSTNESKGRIVVRGNARGRNYQMAKQRAENINYSYAFENNSLKLDSYLTTDISNKKRKQQVETIIYLPKGVILYTDDNTHEFHQNERYQNDILETEMEEHYMLVKDDELECLDCDEIDDEEEIDDFSESSTDESGINITINTNSNDEVDYQIDDDGVKILEDTSETLKDASKKIDSTVNAIDKKDN